MSATSSVSDVDHRIRRSSLPPLLLLLTVPLCLSVVSVRGGLVDSATDVDAASSNARQARAPAPAPAAVAVTQTVAATPAPDPREFCEAETFQPQCSEGEVVMVTDATYGRMQLGRCVRTDYGYVGCQADVMVHLDSKCSGRRTCELRIPDAGLDAAKKCPDEFKTYLNVSHECIPVESAACLFCSKNGYAKLTMQSAFIGSVVTAESQTATSCGSSRCPWVIEVQSGQTINITLFDFAMEQRGAAPGTSVGAEPFVSPDPCFRYAVVKEAPNSKPVPVCGGHGRTQLVYASVTNSVEIHIVSPEVFSRKGQFVLHYEAVGCPDFPIPPYAEMRREGDKVQVTCLENTSEVWERRCVGTQWIGEVRTCPAPYELTKPADGPALPIGLLIAIVLGIALVIGVFIVTVGVVCLKRQRRDYAPPTYQPTYYVQQYQHGGQCYELREDLELPVVDQVSFVGGGGGHGPDTGGAQSKYCGTLPPPKPPRPYAQQQQPGQHHHQGRSDRGFGRENVYAPRMDPQRPLPSLPNIPEAAATAEVSQQQQQQQQQRAGGRPALQFQRSVPGSSTAAAVDPNCPCNQPTRPAAGAQQRQMSQPSGSTVSNPSSSSSRGTVVPSASEASTVLARGRIPSLPCSVGSGGGPSQHYTVLDPTEVQHLLQSGGGVPGASAGGIGSGAMQSSCSGSVYDPTGYGSSFQYQSSFDDVASCGSPSSAGGVGVGLVGGGGPVSGAGVAVGGVVGGGVSGSSGQLASGHEIPLRPARETSQPRLDSAASCAAGSGCSENSSWP